MSSKSITFIILIIKYKVGVKLKKKELSIKQKEAKKDLKIILFTSLIPVLIYCFLGNKIMNFAKTSSANVWIKCLPIMLIQFGMSGLGIIIVLLYRKEKLKDYGLKKDNIFKTIILSVLVCIPHFIFLICNNKVSSYFPLQGSIVTRMLLAEKLPTNIIGYLLCVINWGFLEGLFYPVLSQKINEIYISKNIWLNYGAILSGIICIAIHGMIGFDIITIFEALTTFVLIYGMLIIKEKTNNAWGCILISLFFWNAFR